MKLNTLSRLCLAAVLAVSATGCFHATFIDGSDAGGAPAAMWNQRWYHGAVMGLVDLSGPLSLEEVCPQGWARIEQENGFLNGIAESFTGGLYSPHTVTIFCKGGAAYDAIRDNKGMVVAAIPHVR